MSISKDGWKDTSFPDGEEYSINAIEEDDNSLWLDGVDDDDIDTFLYDDEDELLD